MLVVILIHYKKSVFFFYGFSLLGGGGGTLLEDPPLVMFLKLPDWIYRNFVKIVGINRDPVIKQRPQSLNITWPSEGD